MTLHVEIRGNGPDLVLLHGWLDVGASFQFLVDALEHEWHVIAPDLRGFGRSEWPAEDYWFPNYFANLKALGAKVAAVPAIAAALAREQEIG